MCPVLVPERFLLFGAFALQGFVRIWSFCLRVYHIRPFGAAQFECAVSPKSVIRIFLTLYYHMQKMGSIKNLIIVTIRILYFKSICNSTGQWSLPYISVWIFTS